MCCIDRLNSQLISDTKNSDGSEFFHVFDLAELGMQRRASLLSVFVDLAVFHYQGDHAHHVNIASWVAINSDDIRYLAFFN